MKLRKELWFGFSLMAAIVIPLIVLMPWGNLTNGHLGLMMLALICVGIMLGFPTAFTLMGMGVFFAWLAYRSVDPATAVQRVLDLFVQRTYGVMSNDVLIAIPLFLFMGYLVERAQLIDRLFRSLHLAAARVPGSLAVATIVTCAIFATATGIIGAVVTLMGLLAFPAMLKAGYNVKVAAGAVTAGGCLGIMIPPSVLLIVYGAVAGVSVVQLYAGAFLPGLMLASLYVGYIIVLAKWKPQLMPPLAESERRVELPPWSQTLAQHGSNALTGLARALGAGRGVAKRTALAQLFVTLVPALFIVAVLGISYRVATAPEVEASTAGLVQTGGLVAAPEQEREASTGLIGAPEAEETEAGVEEPPAEGAEEALAAEAETAEGAQEPSDAAPALEEKPAETAAAALKHERLPVPLWLWIVFGIGIVAAAVIYRLWNWQLLEIFKLLLTSFFPLALLIVAVLGSIVFGLATPSEAAAVGGFGG
ncbi:MAG: C4-dicarboxylate ABC transporter, partial [Betaproteobacteria bacterium RIFCSPLOWO2_12_FULL_67_28]